MADRDNHYEAAFEAFLRARQVPYVAVDEAKRSLEGDGSLKSLDFIVSPPAGLSWLVDVKGRKFPGGEEQKTYWKNWSARDDLRSMARWQELFGDGFLAAFVFAYLVLADRAPLPRGELFEFRGARYGFVAIPLADYVPHARPISERWDTVAMPTAAFRQLAVSLPAVLDGRARLAPQSGPAPPSIAEAPDEPF